MSIQVYGDKLGEILHNIRNNKLRVLLTGFAVSWGIFMLIVLLGSGYGIENGIHRSFAEDAINSLWIYPGQTSLPHKGMRQGRTIQLSNHDLTDLSTGVNEVDLSSANFYLWENNTIRVGDRASNFTVVGVHPELQQIENIRMLTGRRLNQRDLKEARKTAVIGKVVHSELFAKTPAVGRYIHINGIAFLVVGVFHDPGDNRQEETIYVPISMMQKVFSGDDNIHNIALTIQADNVPASQAVERKILNRLAARHRFDARDERAVFFYNTFRKYDKYMSLLKNVRTFIWMIGIGSIVAGIVGISNIMLITVKERTREIGIRKAMGAAPGAIIEMILTEAILTTTGFGAIGLVAGILLLEAASRLITQVDYFHNPEINIWVAFGAMMLLVFSGALAGIFPARKAARIRPVEALRDE
jgi:putative ABC transport system permease protein